MIKIVLLKKKKIAEVINRHLIWYVQCTYIQLVLFFSLDNIKTIKNLKDATKWKKPLLKFFFDTRAGSWDVTSSQNMFF